MSARILHLLDTTTSPDAVATLALLIKSDLETHDVAVLGHRSTGRLLQFSRIWNPPDDQGLMAQVHWLPSMGWADPTGWRALRRLLRQLAPTHIHAWGLPAAVAAAVAAPATPRIISLALLPQKLPASVLRLIERGNPLAPARAAKVQWIAMWEWIARRLIAAGVAPGSIRHIPPGIENEARRTLSPAELEILPGDGPILLIAGEGGEAGPDRRPGRAGGIGGGGERARHDFGLWVAGILQQIFPRVRAIIREDQRGRQDHGLERLLNDLADPQIPILAPANCSWEELLPVADVVLIPADGPISMGAALHAMAAGVPVVGTPIEPVREVISDGVNGLIARELKPRAIAARAEELLEKGPAHAGLRDRIISTAKEEVARRFGVDAMVEAHRAAYGLEPAASAAEA